MRVPEGPVCRRPRGWACTPAARCVWESGWDEQSVFAAPPPHPNLVGGAGPSPPWLTGPPCPGTGILSAGQRPAACCIRGGGSMESSLWRQEGPGSAPLPNPGRPLPTASASLETAARARAGAGEENGLCWSQTEARARPWRSSVRPGLRAAGQSQQALLGRQSGLPVTALGWGAGAGLRAPPPPMLTWARPRSGAPHPSAPACAGPRGHAGMRRLSPCLSLHGRALGYGLWAVRAEA